MRINLMQQGRTILSFTPTFFLRKVDPVEILEEYRSGKYAHLTLPATKITVTAAPTVITPTTEMTSDAEIYTYRDKGNGLQTVVTLNQRAYLVAKNGGTLPKDGKCDWCELEPGTETIGIPVRFEETKHMDANGTLHYVTKAYMDGSVGTKHYECSLAYLKRDQGLSIRYRDPLYMDAEQMLRRLYTIAYPNAGPLREAPDRRLFKSRGPLDAAEVQAQGHTYLRTSNVVVAPVKAQYVRN